MSVVRLQIGGATFERAERASGRKVGGLLRCSLATLREWRRRSRERTALARLDERMLRDIGVSRAEAEYIINKPFWRE